MLAASPQGSSPAENWDFRMLNVALGNATTTNGSARTVNVGRPAAMAILRYGTRGPMQYTRSVQRTDSRPNSWAV